VLLPVDDPADQEIPEMGQVTFTSPDGDLVEIDTRNAAARDQYREIWQHRREVLNLMTSRLGIPLMPISTDEEIHQALTRGLARHYGRR
jgi:uncharacterized protein (DUF58 family)